MQSRLLVSQISCPDPVVVKGENYVLDDGPIIKVKFRSPINLWDRFLILAGFAPDYEIVCGFRAFAQLKAAGHLRVTVTVVTD